MDYQLLSISAGLKQYHTYYSCRTLPDEYKQDDRSGYGFWLNPDHFNHHVSDNTNTGARSMSCDTIP